MLTFSYDNIAKIGHYPGYIIKLQLLKFTCLKLSQCFIFLDRHLIKTGIIFTWKVFVSLVSPAFCFVVSYHIFSNMRRMPD